MKQNESKTPKLSMDSVYRLSKFIVQSSPKMLSRLPSWITEKSKGLWAKALQNERKDL